MLSGVEEELQKPIRRTDQLHALAASHQTYVAVGDYGVVLTRARQREGDAWSRQVLPGAPALISLALCPDNTLVALSAERQLWFSQDDALSWQSHPIPTEENLLALTCAPDNRVWAVGSYSTFMVSEDLGQSWDEQSLDEDAMLNTLEFVDTSTAFATGEYGMVARSDDAGASWQLLEPMPGDFYPLSSAFLDAETAWVSGLDGMILHTQDGGETWRVEPTPVQAPLYGLYADAEVQLALGDRGVVLQREGERWVQVTLPSATPAYLRSALRTQADQVLIAGGQGSLFSLSIQ